ncbi:MULTISPECIES: TetR/AcrR family transcriptional regulator [Nocardia]|uniref:TetR family transcriptional regulator n=2 Tax=Nocardia TaxID=1817 RepID=A0A4V3CPP3_NOCIG|nr:MULTISPECIES: TetR/AcrR family transcriptional regulator [Nocardia]MCA2209051.1 TetR/AcrR family transcriptional regulator [Nocardia rosealba]NKX90133.1 TetR/AcrR family transcriptional regulator [Nocardia coubleae]TDP38782.1 TetR family transcriptional regulator [Nocardia ignorata]
MTAPGFDADGRRYRGAAPGQRQQERRARLIEAATEAFGTEGYRNTTVTTICAAAGVGKRYFYESFSDSEDLLLEVYREIAARMIESIHAGISTADTDVTTQVRVALAAYFQLIHDDPRVPRIAFFEILGVSPAVDRAYRDVLDALVDICLALLTPHVDHDAHPAVSVRTVLLGLVGAIVIIAQQWVLSDYRQPIGDVVDSACLVVGAVLERLSP